jgi:multidrug resistance protein MdtO
MVTAATLVMIVSMTFRLPYGAYAALFALNVSRDGLEGTRRAVQSIVVGFFLSGAYLLGGAMLFLGDPMLRFVWIVGTLFLIFHGISATGNLAAWTRFGYMAVITISLWDRHISAQAKMDSVLWAVGMLTMASVIALLLEIAYAALKQGDDLIDPIAERLVCVEQLLRCYASGRDVDATLQSSVARLAMSGTSRLRSILSRHHNGAQYAQEMGAVVALAGRLVDLAANLPHFVVHVAETDRARVGKTADRIAQIRQGLINGSTPSGAGPGGEIEAWPDLPLFSEIEKTALLIPEVFSGSRSLKIFDPPAPETGGGPPAIARGRLLDPEHLKFGLKGCLAASLCYIIYSALFWPEISTSVTTCFLTALTTIGASHQKQVLRFAGALLGGFVFGMGSQVFVLPYIDSIAGFTVLFVVVSSFAAWIIISSPRLSYLGVQVAFAFFLINLQEFKIQTSLVVARDRVAGILIGLLVMWLVFDQLWSTPAGVAMKKAFTSGLRLLAQLAREPLSSDLHRAVARSYSLRETINTQFDKVRSLADAVLFEFGPSRHKDLELRNFIRTWQPLLRTLFIMRIASWRYRAQVPGFEFPETIRGLQAAYDEQSAGMLEQMADWIEEDRTVIGLRLDESAELLKRTIEQAQAEESRGLSGGSAQSFITLVRGIDGLTTSLAGEVAAESSHGRSFDTVEKTATHIPRDPLF